MWIPPKSPYGLIQERYWPDKWKVLVCCLMLNQTSRKQLDHIIEGFFREFPDPDALLKASDADILRHISHLGMQNRRLKILRRFSAEFKAGKWSTAKDLYGCGKYADDCYRIFFVGDWKLVEPKDHALNYYHSWLWLRETDPKAASLPIAKNQREGKRLVAHAMSCPEMKTGFEKAQQAKA